MTSKKKPLSGKVVLWSALVTLVVVFVPAVVVPTLISPPKPPVLDDYGALPAIRLVDEEGTAVANEDLRGHVLIVGFIFTRCEVECPLVSMKMARIQTATGDVGDRVKLLSITMDPEFDQPEVLRAYARRFEADPARWRFLTGDADHVQSLIEGPFMTGVERLADAASGAPVFRHGQHFLLVDKSLHIRGAYDSREPRRLEDLARAARWLARR